MLPEKERRKQPLRRQVNDAFTDQDGHFSPVKTVAVFAQITVLYHFGRSFDALIPHADTMAVLVLVLIAPDAIKKFISMKYGNGNGK